jgi:hypothetical protein
MNWKLTATTLFCDSVKRWVPILVFKEGRAHCGYFFRHGASRRKNHRVPACEGPQECTLCKAYQEDVFRRNGREQNG